jgi:hypothetical protein
MKQALRTLIVITLCVPQESMADEAQPVSWIRGQFEDEYGNRRTLWLSPEKQVWSLQSEKVTTFCNNLEEVRLDYYPSSNEIHKTWICDQSLQDILPLEALAENAQSLGTVLLGSEKIIRQNRVELVENGRPWIEFQMVLANVDKDFLNLRVDPATRLPVRIERNWDPKYQSKCPPDRWVFDTPAEGPRDIYDLGVPRDAPVKDLAPPHEIRSLLVRMAAGRESLGDFALTVGQTFHSANREPSFGGHMVYRCDERWRVDFISGIIGNDLPPHALELEWSDWFRRQKFAVLDQTICDGSSVWRKGASRGRGEVHWRFQEQILPSDLWGSARSGFQIHEREAMAILSQVYPDPMSFRGEMQLDRSPEDTTGCVVLKSIRRDPETLQSVMEHWTTVDTARGFAVVKSELIRRNEHGVAEVEQEVTMESFVQTPTGFWYPMIVRRNDRGANQIMVSLTNSNRQSKEIRQTTNQETVTYLYFDPNPKLADSLFEIDLKQIAP